MSERGGRVVPVKFECLRRVPQYDRFIHERFEHCLYLYLLPRKLRKKSVINPRDLLHKMPDMADLKPFPEQLSVEYIGHARSVRALDVSACGLWLATGSDDATVRVFEVDSGREFFRHSLGAVNRVEAVQFNSLPARQSLLSAVCLHLCLLIPLLPGLGRGPQETRARAHSAHPPTCRICRRCLSRCSKIGNPLHYLL